MEWSRSINTQVKNNLQYSLYWSQCTYYFLPLLIVMSQTQRWCQNIFYYCRESQQEQRMMTSHLYMTEAPPTTPPQSFNEKHQSLLVAECDQTAGCLFSKHSGKQSPFLLILWRTETSGSPNWVLQVADDAWWAPPWNSSDYRRPTAPAGYFLIWTAFNFKYQTVSTSNRLQIHAARWVKSEKL